MYKYTSLIHAPLEDLLAESNVLRASRFGNDVHVCAIINAKSGNCSNDCIFCAQSSHYSGASEVYALLDNAILHLQLEKLRRKMPGNIGLVCSGRALGGRELARLCEFISSLDATARARLCLSAGTLGKDALHALAQAGLVHYHHNLESSERYYSRICTTQKWRSRRQTVVDALALGFELCCGCLFGLGESWADRISLALELKELGVRNVPLNFLAPRPGTPLESKPLLSAQEALRIVAIFRIILPDAILRICGGRKDCFGSMQVRMFEAGANALISGNYLTAAGMAFEEDCRLLESCGLCFTEKLS